MVYLNHPPWSWKRGSNKNQTFGSNWNIRDLEARFAFPRLGSSKTGHRVWTQVSIWWRGVPKIQRSSSHTPTISGHWTFIISSKHRLIWLSVHQAGIPGHASIGFAYSFIRIGYSLRPQHWLCSRARDALHVPAKRQRRQSWKSDIFTCDRVNFQRESISIKASFKSLLKQKKTLILGCTTLCLHRNYHIVSLIYKAVSKR